MSRRFPPACGPVRRPAAVDAAFRIDLLEVGLFGLADHAVGGSGSAVGHDVADLDFGVGRTGVVFLLGECSAAHGGESDDRRRERGDSWFSRKHSFS
jgi:hypothetical protein